MFDVLNSSVREQKKKKYNMQVQEKVQQAPVHYYYILWKVYFN